MNSGSEYLSLDFFKSGWSAQSCLSNASAASSLFSRPKAIFQEQLVQVYDASSEVIFHGILRSAMTWSIEPICEFLCQFFLPIPVSFPTFAMSPGKRGYRRSGFNMLGCRKTSL